MNLIQEAMSNAAQQQMLQDSMNLFAINIGSDILLNKLKSQEQRSKKFTYKKITVTRYIS